MCWGNVGPGVKGLVGQLCSHQPGGRPDIIIAQELGPPGGRLWKVWLPCGALTLGAVLPTAGGLLTLLERYAAS